MLFEFELILLIVMVGTMLLYSTVFKMPLSVSMILASLAGALAGGQGIPLRHLFEGCFGMLDSVMLICCAMIFMKVVSEIGTLDACGGTIIRRFHRRPVVMLLLLGLLMLIPGMLTGTAAVSIIGVGAVILPVLTAMGMPHSETGALLAVCGTLAMAAPPVNIPAMMIASSVDMKYQGFTGPLLFLTVLGTIFTIFWFGRPYLRAIDLDRVSSQIDFEAGGRYGVSIYIPILLVLAAIGAIRIFPGAFPDIGNPLVFMAGALIGCRFGKTCSIVKTAVSAIDAAIPIVARMMAVGMFIQIFNLLGIRGYIVGNCIVLPSVLLMLAAVIIMPLFGGISVYGSAMLLGGPIILATMTGNEIIIAAAASVLAVLGEIMPPTAIATYFAANLAGGESRKIIRLSLIPCLFLMLLCFFCMACSNWFDFLIL